MSFSQYRYRPWAVNKSRASNSQSRFEDITPTQANYLHEAATALDGSPFLSGKAEQGNELELPVMVPDTDHAFGSFLPPTFGDFVEHDTFGMTQAYRSLDVFPQHSPRASPWLSSDSSVASDTSSAMWSSPANSVSYSPEPQFHRNSVDTTCWSGDRGSIASTGTCVSMHEVQNELENEPSYLAPQAYYPNLTNQWQFASAGMMELPMEGSYDSMQYTSSHASPYFPQDNLLSDDEVTPTGPRHQRDTPQMSMASPPLLTTKPRPSIETPLGRTGHFQEQVLEFPAPLRHAKSKGTKTAAFPCPLASYGCTSSFISKNEWKRHISTQHLRLETWRCDQCPKRDSRPADFNRKDLFVQHLKRMHHPASNQSGHHPHCHKSKPNKGSTKAAKSNKVEELDPALATAEQRCHIRLRQPPMHSGCLFCPALFSGCGSWEERVEHVAKHMETDRKAGRSVPEPRRWNHDPALEQWLVENNVVSKVRHQWSIA